MRMDPNRKTPDWRGVLLKDNKLICDIQSYKVPTTLPSSLIIHNFDSDSIFPLSSLPTFEFHPLGPNPARLGEWQRFLTFLMTHHKVAIIAFPGWELLINPPVNGFIHPKQPVVVSYRRKSPGVQKFISPLEPVFNSSLPARNWNVTAGQLSGVSGSQKSSHQNAVKQEPTRKPLNEKPRFAQTHPSYLETLGQNHASWIFGALAELVDNARDAQARRLDINIEQEFFKAAGVHIPVLSVTDNGTGMSHSEVVRMLSFGHKKPDIDSEDLIGRFGVGFKTGSMRLGKDVVVFTQSKETRSIAFLSRSLNEDKEEVEIPIITYRKDGGWMEFDLQVHSQEEAEARLMAVKEYSPFNEYSIGHKFSLFQQGTGTTICIYNLDRWGSDYSLQWDPKVTTETGQKFKRDITIRSRRVRSRPAQMTKEVPLDYSLHAYLEVMFLEPRMKIYVQGTQVETRRLHKSLTKTRLFKDTLLGKKVELFVGLSQAERERGNCGVFLYWHGRLIEAYKRVGGMIHTADMGRGVIGVIDVTDIMRVENGSVAVLNNKQGFQDFPEYQDLFDWLGNMTNTYWDDLFDTLKLGQKVENAVYTPDNNWVQCNKCLKWRVLDPQVDSSQLPDEWFCYMPPFKGSCSMPEEEVEAGIVTVGATRTYGNTRVCGNTSTQVKEDELSTTAGNSAVSNDKDASDVSTGTDDNAKSAKLKASTMRRIKRPPPTQVSKGRQAAAKKSRKSS